MANLIDTQTTVGTDDEQINLSDFVATIYSSRWLITGVTLFITLIALLYAFLGRPIYSADVMIQVETTDGGASNLLGALSPLLDNSAATTAEIELLRSRLVVGKAVSSLHLYISAEPKHFPLIGGWVSASHEKSMMGSAPGSLAHPMFGLPRYAWGGESIDVVSFDVPDTYWTKKFTVVNQTDGRYELLGPDGSRVLSGRLGVLERGHVDDGEISLRINSINANESTRFTLVRSSELDTIQNLQDSLTIGEKGKQSGILGVTLEGPNPAQARTVLNFIASEYVRQNILRKSAEAEKTLAFLDGQLPKLKRELDDSEQLYNRFRNQSGSVNLSQEAALTLQQSVDGKEMLLQLQQKRAELTQRFGPAHPSVVAIDKQIADQQAQIGSLGRQVGTLPNLQQTAIRLLRNVTVNNDLYISLLNNAQQLRALKAGKVGNVRVVDYAPQPEEPVKPKKALVVALGVIFGLLIGVGTAFFRRTVFGGVEDGLVIERATGLSVYATVPFSANQRTLDALVGEQGGRQLLAEKYPDDVTVESLRSLRTSLQFAMLDARNNIVMVTSPSPGVGKSFTLTNLAVILADSGKKVLLIDGDMRRGHTHDSFGLKRDVGLSDLIAGSCDISSVIHAEVLERLDFISTGALPPRPAELLISGRFKELLDILSVRYDIVLIDAPPVLAVTDAALIGAMSGTTLLGLRYGMHPIGEINEAIRRLMQSGVVLKGAILNGIPRASTGYGRHLTRYYNYDYSPVSKR